MSLMCLLAPTSIAATIDVNKCMRLALVHDMAESIVGDITPMDKVPKAEKERRERATMEYFEKDVLGGYDGGAQGRMLRALWEEYEAAETKEAQFVKDVDKVELLLQMVDYERRGEGELDLGEFAWVSSFVKGEVCQAWVEEILEERSRAWKAFGKVPKGLVATESNGQEEKVVESVNGAERTEREEWEYRGELAEQRLHEQNLKRKFEQLQNGHVDGTAT